MKNMKKLLSLLLAAALVVSAVPQTALAAAPGAPGFAAEAAAPSEEAAPAGIPVFEGERDTEAAQAPAPAAESPASEAAQPAPEAQAPAQDPASAPDPADLPAPAGLPEKTYETLDTSGTCGDDLTWTLSDAGVLTISGTGAMTDFTGTSAVPWYSSRTSIKSVTVSSGVTSIGSYAFYNCTAMTAVSIPTTVTSIGNRVFYNCSALTSLAIPASVTSIGSNFTFTGCTSLTTITVNSSNANYSSVNGVLFNKSKNRLIVCPAGKSGSYTVPELVNTIASDAFYGCSKLTSVTIGAKVQIIESEAFYKCTGLTSVTIPASVLYLRARAFGNCSKLSSITFQGDAPTFYSDTFQSVTATANYPAGYVGWTSEILQNYGGTLTWVQYGLVASGECGAEGDNLLWELNEDGRLCITGSGAMADYASGGAPWYSNRASILSVKISGATTIGNYAFASCTKIAAVDYGSSLVTIGNRAFDSCYANMSLAIPNTVTSIGSYAFYYNRSATTVSIPASVTSIGAYAFTFCGKVESFTVNANNANFASEDGVLFNKSKTQLRFYPAGNARTSYTVPASVTSIGGYAFGQAKNLTSLDLNQVATLNNGAIRSCSGLTTITIPDTVTFIGGDVFGTCENLQSVVFGSGVNSLGSKLFVGCNSLTEMTFKGDAPATIKDDAFNGVTATAYYPPGNTTWTEEKKDNYGGTITWVEKPVFFDLWIDGVQVTSANAGDVLGNGMFEYHWGDAAGNWLYIRGGSYSGTSEALIYTTLLSLSIIADFTTVLENASESETAAVIRSSGCDLFIEGRGRLFLRCTADSDETCAVDFIGNNNRLGITHKNLVIRNVANGLRASGNSTTYKRYLEFEGCNASIQTFSGGSVTGFDGGVTLTNGAKYVYPAYATVENGSVVVDDILSDSYVVWNNLEISNSAYDLIINGKRVADNNKSDVWDNGVFSFDSDTNTLTVDGEYNTSETWGMWGFIRDQPIIDNAIDGLTIELAGSCELLSGLENYVNYTPAIRSNGDLTVRGASALDHPVLGLREAPHGGGTFDGIHMVHGDLVLENLDLQIYRNQEYTSDFGHGLVGLNDDCSVTFRSVLAFIYCYGLVTDITPAALTGFKGGVTFEGCGIDVREDEDVILTDGTFYDADGDVASTLTIKTTTYDIIIEGYRVFDENHLSSWWCQYDPETNTLRLDMSRYGAAPFTSNYMPLIQNHMSGLTISIGDIGALDSSAVKPGRGLIESDVDMTITSETYESSVTPGLFARQTLALDGGSNDVTGILMKNGATLTLNDAEVRLFHMTYGLRGQGGAKLNIVNSAVEIIDSSFAALYSFSGGVTLNGCTIRTPEGGQIINGTAYEADGATPAKDVYIFYAGYDLRVGGYRVYSTNQDDITEDGSFAYDPVSNTLTIKKSYSFGENGVLIWNEIPGLKISVPSDVTLTSTWGEEGSSLIYSKCDLTITGPGRLTLHGCGLSESYGVKLSGDGTTLTLQNADVVTENLAYGLSGVNITVQSLAAVSSTLDATASVAAVSRFNGGVDLTGCKIVEPDPYTLNSEGTVCADGSPAAHVVIGPPTAYDLWLGETQVTETNTADILGDGTATYNPDTKTLTFTAATPAITGVHENALIYAANDLTVNAPEGGLKPAAGSANYLIYSDNGSITLNGDADVSNANGSGLRAGENITVNGSVTGICKNLPFNARNGSILVTGNVDVTHTNSGSSYVIYASQDIEIRGSAQVKMTGDATYLIYSANGGITLNGDVDVSNPGNGMGGYGLYADQNITVNGSVTGACKHSTLLSVNGSILVTGDVDVTSTGSGSFSVIRAYEDIKIRGSARVRTTGDSDYGLSTFNGTVTMVAGTWDIEVETAAICAGGGITIPATHAITTPASGSVTRIQFENGKYYYTVTTNGTTKAAHVVIEKVAYDLWVGSTQVTLFNKDDILGDGSVSYDPDTKTLTFTTATPAITGVHLNALIYAADDLTVNAPAGGLKPAAGSATYLIYSKNGSITLNGDVDTSIAHGIGLHAEENITVNGSVTGTCLNEPLYAGSGSILVTGDLDVTSTGSNRNCVIYASQDMEIQGSAAVKTTGDALHLIRSENGSITLTGDVDVSNANGYGLWAKQNVTVNGSVTGTCLNQPLYAGSGSILVTGDLDVTSTGSGKRSVIYASQDIGIRGSATVKTTGDAACGLRAAYGTVTVGSGAWNIAGTTAAIYAGTGITIPATHTVTIPEGGAVTRLTSEGTTYYTVSADGTTPAAHVVIEPDYGLWVGSTKVTSVNKDDILGDGSVSYNPDTKTLTFTADYVKLWSHIVEVGSVRFYATIWAEGDLIIRTPGSLTLDNWVPIGDYDNIRSFNVYGKGDLTVYGDLVINSEYEDALYAMGSITVNGSVDLTMTNMYNGIAICSMGGTDGVRITGDLNIRCCRDYAVDAVVGDITVDGAVYVRNSKEGAFGLYAYNGALNVGSGTWEISTEGTAVYAKTGISIPASQAIVTPEGGAVSRVTIAGRTVCTVTEADGTTVAAHVIIENKYAGLISHNVSFGSSMALIYYVYAEPLEGCSNIRLVGTREKHAKNSTAVTYEDVVLTEYLETDSGYGLEYKFTYPSIAAKEVGDVLRLKVVAEKNGVTVESPVDEYCVADYAYNRLRKSSNSSFKTMIADMLYYCADAQTYFGYDTAHLVTGRMTEAYAAYATQGDVTIENHKREIPVAGATAEWTGNSAVFDSNVQLKYYFTLNGASAQGVKLVLTYTTLTGTPVTDTVNVSDCLYDEGYDEYAYSYDGLAAKDMRVILTAKLMRGSTQISSTLEDSLESYAARRLAGSGNEAFKVLMRSMMKFGLSAEAYFQSQP